MGVKLSSRREWDKNIKMNGEAAEIDESNEVDLAIKGSAIRAAQHGDFETLANLTHCAGAFKIKGKITPVKVGTSTTTVLTDLTGNTHEVTDDPALVDSYVKAGMSITSTSSVDIMG